MSTMKFERRAEAGADPEGHEPHEVMDRLAGLLPEGALGDAVRGLRAEEVSGPGGLLSQLAGRVVEAALEAELTEHLGHPPGGRPQGPNADAAVGLRREVRTEVVQHERQPQVRRVERADVAAEREKLAAALAQFDVTIEPVAAQIVGGQQASDAVRALVGRSP